MSNSLSVHSDLEPAIKSTKHKSPTISGREQSSQLGLSRGTFLSQLLYSGLLSLFVMVASWSSPVSALESDSLPAPAGAVKVSDDMDLGRSNVVNENDTMQSTSPPTTSESVSNNQTLSDFGNLLSVWTKPTTTSQLGEAHHDRTIYLLATAESQATTYEGPAKDLVRKVLPEGVFVQLDPKRVLTPSTDAFLRRMRDAVNRHDTRIVIPTVHLEDDDDKEWFLAENAMSSQQLKSPQEWHHHRQPRHRPWWQSLIAMGRVFYDMALARSPSLSMQLSAANVDSLAAMDLGLQLGSKVILGDEDTDVMLTQVLKAIQVAMRREDGDEDIPPLSGGMGTTNKVVPFQNKNGIESIQDGLESMDAIQASLTLSERLKARAPEIYQAIYARRSKYMATALDELNTYGSLLAIVGVSHVEDMKKLLQKKGWTEETTSTNLVV